MIARALVEVLSPPVRGLLGANPAVVAACHDVGKVSPGYQLKYFREQLRQKLPELAAHALANYETKHALIGELAINASLAASQSNAGLAAGAHHGARDDRGLRHDDAVLGGPAWSAERLALIERLVHEFGALTAEEDVDSHVLAGLVCVADWLGSDERFFDPCAGRSADQSQASATAAVSECGWLPTAITRELGFAEVFGFEPHPLQREFVEAVQGPGLYVLEAPMGSGKTEAALYAAYRLMTSGANCGLYFGLPTRLTSDKIHQRVATFLHRIAGNEVAVRLAHGNAWLRAFHLGGGELAPGNGWFNPAKRALLMPFAVGTIDQALMAVIKVRHFFVRCFGLAGKVVILDEVHSYDVYTGTLLDLLVRRLLAMKCTVIVLSATLTAARRASLLARPPLAGQANDYPLITAETPARAWVQPASPPLSVNVTVELLDLRDADVAERATRHAAAGECVLCVANTVGTAQAWYNHVKASMVEGSFEVGLLHSRFPAWRREELEARWTAALGKAGPRPSGCVLIGTQVVEQSVDLDADFMISELAPTDMLLQRIGRLWRHTRPGRPCTQSCVVIIARDLDAAKSLEDLILAIGKSNSRVYAPYVLWRSFQAWKRLQALRLPDQIRNLLEQTYAEPESEPPFVEVARASLERRRQRLRDLAVAARADAFGFPTMKDDERAATRYSDYATIDLVIAKRVGSMGTAAELVLANGKRVQLDAERWVPPFAVELHRNLVSVPAYRLPGADTPPYLKRYLFDRTPVLTLDGGGELALDGRQTGLRYDDERGVQTGGPVPPWLAQRPRGSGSDEDGDGGFDELDW
jgi:CRISPR-associated endonuclease/helicase Cas3